MLPSEVFELTLADGFQLAYYYAPWVILPISKGGTEKSKSRESKLQKPIREKMRNVVDEKEGGGGFMAK